jgi:hypothetical protein
MLLFIRTLSATTYRVFIFVCLFIICSLSKAGFLEDIKIGGFNHAVLLQTSSNEDSEDESDDDDDDDDGNGNNGGGGNEDDDMGRSSRLFKQQRPPSNLSYAAPESFLDSTPMNAHSKSKGSA